MPAKETKDKDIETEPAYVQKYIPESLDKLSAMLLNIPMTKVLLGLGFLNLHLSSKNTIYLIQCRLLLTSYTAGYAAAKQIHPTQVYQLVLENLLVNAFARFSKPRCSPCFSITSSVFLGINAFKF